jgi:hypothetical protein
VARRRKTKGKRKKVSLKLRRSKRRSRLRSVLSASGLKAALKVSAVIIVLAGVVAGILFLGRYVKETVPASDGAVRLRLAGVPGWVNEELERKIYTAAIADGEDLRVDEDAAESVQKNVESLVAWLADVKVQVAHDIIEIRGRWRKPLAMVKTGLREPYYVDAEMVVLDFVAMPNLPIVKVKGLSRGLRAPFAGEVSRENDLAAAVEILALLDQRDRIDTSVRPLLYEIESIDVSNFNGRQNSRAPHIILYAKDRTEIIWGAEMGSWQRHLEVPDEEKVARLYGHYKEYGSLQNNVKYINLCEPQERIPLPVDKY